MAMSCMIRRASITMSASINNAISSSAHHFCTDSKKKLLNEEILKALKSEIKSEEQRLIKHAPPVPPPNFPFTIVEHPYDSNTITLKRDFNGEKIELLVRYFDDHDFEEEEEEIAANRFAPSVEVDVKISKKSGRKIEIQVSADTDDISANTMSVAEESPAKLLGEYWVGGEDEDEMAMAMREYLEMRGLNKSYVPFVCNYMVSKSKRCPLLVLQKLKNFLEESN